MASLRSLFWSFFKVGTFTIGGGYAMIPLMQEELVNKHKWMSEKDFMDQIALSQALPGVFAVNMATGVGYKLKGIPGAIVAVAGNIVMPIAIILLFAIGLRQFKDLPIVAHIFMGIRPAVVALIAAPVFEMCKKVKPAWRNAWIPILAALLIWLIGVSPVLIILGTLALGTLYYRLKGGNA